MKLKLEKLELNSDGVKQLLKSQEMRAIIERETSRVEMNAAGSSDGYVGDVRAGQNRLIGMVKVKSKEAYHDNLENNTLIKSLHR